MRKILIVFLLIPIFVTTGCKSTATALAKPVPDKYLEVIQDNPSVDVESELKLSNVDYVCKEIYAGKGSSKNRRACFVKVPEESTYKDLGVKLTDVSIAFLEDSGRNSIVVGKVFIGAVLNYIGLSPPTNTQ